MEEPLRLRIGSERWQAVLAWLHSAPMRVSALELHVTQAKVGRPPLAIACCGASNRLSTLSTVLPRHVQSVTASGSAAQEKAEAGEALADLLADAGFQARCGPHLADISVAFGLDAPALPLGGRVPCVWGALRSLSLLRVRPQWGCRLARRLQGAWSHTSPNRPALIDSTGSCGFFCSSDSIRIALVTKRSVCSAVSKITLGSPAAPALVHCQES